MPEWLACLLLGAGAALTLGLLLVHASYYHFLCDDAFISFRYLSNLLAGNGLVFNPGQPPVEGYTNFLWIVLLSGLQAAGLTPEFGSVAASMVLTVALWAVIAYYAWRRRPAGGAVWLVLVPLLLLAATRSVAVWSTGGLETRLFEFLVVAGIVLLISETADRLGGRNRVGWSALLLALATLTRPDGLLIAGVALVIAQGYLLLQRSFSWRLAGSQAALLLLPVAAHVAFRLAYYGQWLPNTYYAKVDGTTWWSLGWQYLATFALEYALYLWLPLLAAAFWRCRQRSSVVIPLLLIGVPAAHAVYIAAIGGDHFEYRPLTLYFPLLLLALYEGACALAARGRWRQVAVGCYVLLIGLGLSYLPWRMHQAYAELTRGSGLVAAWQPAADPVYQYPPLRQLGETYAALNAQLRQRGANIRQEEHAALLPTLVAQGRQLRQMVVDEVLPPDTHIAVDGVGAIAYYSQLPVLDRLGLTDRHVARQPFLENNRMVAHGKRADLAYARDMGVDLWAADPTHLLLPATHESWPLRFARSLRVRPDQDPTQVAKAGAGWWLLAVLPQGGAAASARFPYLRFRSLSSVATRTDVIREVEGGLREALESEPAAVRHAVTLGQLLLLQRRAAAAVAICETSLAHATDDHRLWLMLASAREMQRQYADAEAALDQALALSQQRGATQLGELVRQRLDRVRALAGRDSS